MAKPKFRLVKGFTDFYPQDLAKARWVFQKARQVSQLFGYQEYEGPALEELGLYAAKSGEELVKKQTFVLQDRGGRKLALRPELTPTLARMVAQKREKLTFPIRWFSIGPRWRYEKPQKGRGREFYQWDVDLIGNTTPEADAEVIAIAAEFLKSLGFGAKEVVIKVNNRRLMDAKLDLIEVKKEQIPLVFRAIDKKDKMSPVSWKSYLKEIGLNQLQIKDLEKILQDKDFGGESDELTQTFSTLQDLGYGDYVDFDPRVVRGLDYYTGTVFEARDRKRKFRAILGGGRYDNLVEVVGGGKLSGVGFAAGVAGSVVLVEMLDKFKKYPDLISIPTKVLVTVFDAGFYRQSLELTKKVREKGIATEVFLDENVKLDKQLKYADKKNVPFVIILGPEEIKKKAVTLRDMKAKSQEQLNFKQLLERLG